MVAHATTRPQLILVMKKKEIFLNKLRSASELGGREFKSRSRPLFKPCSPNLNLLALTHPILPGCQPAKIFDVCGFLGLYNPNPNPNPRNLGLSGPDGRQFSSIFKFFCDFCKNNPQLLGLGLHNTKNHRHRKF